MNTEQQTRLEIMRALDKEFPELLFEDLIHVARYIEHGGVKHEPPEQTGHPSEQGAPRKWVSLADIPDNVRWVKDHEGDLIKRFAFAENVLWVYTSHDYADIQPTDDDGPFTGALS